MATSSLSAFCLVVLFTLANSLDPPDEFCTPAELALENVRKLAISNNELALNLHRKFSNESSENVFFSPLGLSTIFGMLFYGARGDTAKELLSVLGYNEANLPDDQVHATFKHLLTYILKNSNDEYVLDTANAILVDKRLGLSQDYVKNIEAFYGSSVKDVDFESDSVGVMDRINNWVMSKTNGKIDKLLDELSPVSALVLLNAMYFKGMWKTQFKKEHTRTQLFYNGGLRSDAKNVTMMHVKGNFLHTLSDNYKGLELPYKGDNMSMLILLPNAPDGLPYLEKNLDLENLTNIRNNLYDSEVHISLPRFKIQYSRELSGDLQALGATRMFDEGSADFSGMTPSNNVIVNQVLHKAVVEVNEMGSKAAATTAVVMGYRMLPIRQDFVAQHPFLFFIMEKGSDMILFMGRVNSL